MFTIAPCPAARITCASCLTDSITPVRHGVDHRPPLVDGVVGDEAEGAEARGVHRGVEPTELARPPGATMRSTSASSVTSTTSPTAAPPSSVDGGVERLGVAVAEHDPGALPHEAARALQPDPRAAARDHRDPTVQPSRHRVSPRPSWAPFYRVAPTSSRSSPGSGVDRRRRRTTLEVEVGQDPVEPARQPPVGVAEQLHRRGHEHEADDRRVDEHRRREAEAHHLHGRLVDEDEAQEDADHDERGRRDHACRGREPGGHALPCVAGAQPLLPDT